MHPLPSPNVALFKADLHCHTSCSDGSFTPKEIIDMALQKGLSALVITDHDTIDAYSEAVPYAKEKKLHLGTGVEFSCEHQKKSVHVLGYDFCLKDQNFLAYCLRQQEKRVLRNKEILQKLEKLKIFIEEKDLLLAHEKAATLGRPHIASVMVQKGYVKSIQEAFQTYLGDGKCCFVPGEPFPVLEALSVIHKAGGKAFLAHPHMYNDSNFVRDILLSPFDGIECYYGNSHPNKVKRWLKIAQKKNLLISGGSDFHGLAKPYVSLGSSWVDQETFFKIFEKNIIC